MQRFCGRCAVGLLEEQERDWGVWKGMSKVVCDTRGQSGELQVGNSRGHQSRSLGHRREEPSTTDILSDVESYWRVLSRGVAQSDLQLTRISIANNRQKCPPVVTPKYAVYSSYNIASLSSVLKGQGHVIKRSILREPAQ